MKQKIVLMLVCVLLASCAGLTGNDSEELGRQATQTAVELNDLEGRVEQVESQLAGVNQQLETYLSEPNDNAAIQETVDQLQTQLNQLEEVLTTASSGDSSELTQPIVNALIQIGEIQSKLDSLGVEVNESIARLESLEAESPDETNIDELLTAVDDLQNRLALIESQPTVPTVAATTDDLESTQTPTAPTSPPPVSTDPEDCTTSFMEDFSSNLNVILETNSAGTIRLSMERLLVTANRDGWIWVPIQNVMVCDEFYVEFEMQMAEGPNTLTGMGIGLGDSEGNVHRFMLVGGSPDRIAFIDNNAQIFSTAYGNLYSQGETHRIGLEALGGLFTLYVDGQATESSVIQPYGNVIGIIVADRGWSSNHALATAAFDNLTIREFREQ